MKFMEMPCAGPIGGRGLTGELPGAPTRGTRSSSAVRMLCCSPQRITVPRQRRDGGARDDVDAACVAKCRARVTFVRGPSSVRPPLTER